MGPLPQGAGRRGDRGARGGISRRTAPATGKRELLGSARTPVRSHSTLMPCLQAPCPTDLELLCGHGLTPAAPQQGLRTSTPNPCFSQKGERRKGQRAAPRTGSPQLPPNTSFPCSSHRQPQHQRVPRSEARRNGARSGAGTSPRKPRRAAPLPDRGHPAPASVRSRTTKGGGFGKLSCLSWML